MDPADEDRAALAAEVSQLEYPAMLDPDHPLLARAQRALKQQLERNKLRLDEELRERNIMLNVRTAGSGLGTACMAHAGMAC